MRKVAPLQECEQCAASSERLKAAKGAATPMWPVATRGDAS